MTLQINVNLPPRLIERAREQQSERRLAAVASQRRAVVRKEAARQVTAQRALAGRDAQGKDLRAGAVADDRRRRPVLAHQTKQYQVGFLQEVISPQTLEVKCLSGKTIIKTEFSDSLYEVGVVSLVPVNKKLILFCYSENRAQGVFYSWYLCNEDSFKEIGPKSAALFEKAHYIGRFGYEIGWGFGGVYSRFTGFETVTFTPGLLYLLNDLQPDQWTVKPRISLLQRIEDNSGQQEYTSVDFYISRETQGKYGFPEWWLPPGEEFPDVRPDWPIANHSVKKSERMSLKVLNKFNDQNAYAINFLVWDWGQPSLCRELLYSLGFTESELTL